MQPHLMLAMRRKDLTTATRGLERALDLQPYNTDTLVLLADLYIAQGQAQRGQERLEEALRFDPRHRAAKWHSATLFPLRAPGMASANGRFIRC